MPCTPMLYFGPFACDLANVCLWRGHQVIRLTPKAFAVLHYLLERTGQLATKEELLRVVWPETTLSEAVLAVAIHEVRRALQDSARTPRFIETVHRRGYRFMADVRPTPEYVGCVPPGSATSHCQTYFTGRTRELGRLEQWLHQSLAGRRQVGFIAGETGIGKTALVQAFIARAQAQHALWVGSGQCVEQYGAGEAYLPILEALGRLGRTPAGAHLIAILQRYAPTCLIQLPALRPLTDDLPRPWQDERPVQECMLREMVEAIEVLATVQPVVLVLEDLHWSDAATLAWLSCVARRRDPARVLILGTYRPTEVLVRQHALQEVKQELHLQRQCHELLLEGLAEAEGVDYLRARYGEALSGAPLPHLMVRRTNGNPLLMRILTEALRGPEAYQRPRQHAWGEELSAEVACPMPESLQQLLELQLALVSVEDRALLETASVVGRSFSAAAVAAAMAHPVEDIACRLAALARQYQFVRPARPAMGLAGAGLDAALYRFMPPLYQEAFYARIPASRRARLQHAVAAQRRRNA